MPSIRCIYHTTIRSNGKHKHIAVVPSLEVLIIIVIDEYGASEDRQLFPLPFPSVEPRKFRRGEIPQ